MKKNVGITDKVVRLFLAGVVAVLYFSGIISGTLAIVLLVVAAIFVVTSFISFCPIYRPFGISSCKINESK